MATPVGTPANSDGKVLCRLDVMLESELMALYMEPKHPQLGAFLIFKTVRFDPDSTTKNRLHPSVIVELGKPDTGIVVESVMKMFVDGVVFDRFNEKAHQSVPFNFVGERVLQFIKNRSQVDYPPYLLGAVTKQAADTIAQKFRKVGALKKDAHGGFSMQATFPFTVSMAKGETILAVFLSYLVRQMIPPILAAIEQEIKHAVTAASTMPLVANSTAIDWGTYVTELRVDPPSDKRSNVSVFVRITAAHTLTEVDVQRTVALGNVLDQNLSSGLMPTREVPRNLLSIVRQRLDPTHSLLAFKLPAAKAKPTTKNGSEPAPAKTTPTREEDTDADPEEEEDGADEEHDQDAELGGKLAGEGGDVSPVAGEKKENA